MRKFRLTLLLLVLAVVVQGCASRPKLPLTGLVPGRQMDTLNSAIAISVRTAERSIGGRGFLIFKRPDRFRLAMLSPFGGTLADIYSDGDRFTCLIPSRQTAYTGSMEELPEREGLKAWALMRWVVELPSPSGPSPVTRVNAAGFKERLYFNEDGLLERKETDEGDRVVYGDYRAVDGVAFPETIELTDNRGSVVKVRFEDPEINRAVVEKTLTPDVHGVRVLPFSEFRGF